MILGYFCPFTQLTTRKIKILKKWKKMPGDIIILHLCTTNDNHMKYGSWDIERDRHNFLPFSTIFCPFTPLTIRKIKILKKLIKTPIYYHFTHVYHKWKSYDVWFLRYGARQTGFFLFLNNFLPFCPPLTTQKIKIWKKKSGDIIILHKCIKNHDHMLLFLRSGVWRM